MNRIKVRILNAFVLGLWLTLVQSPANTRAAGVTIITHGFNGNVNDWIIPMGQKVVNYDLFPGLSFTCYEIDVANDYSVTQSRIGGTSPLNSDSGEIIIKLDWSALSIAVDNSSTDIAATVVPKLISTTFIPELGGRSLVEFPIHLIGHSRGGSVVTEMARLLGQQGLWVDHLTTLDPHPVTIPYGDADIYLYENVLFADNYWEINPDAFCPVGESVFGAYNRYLANLANGYACNHSDAHLWYHGTIDWQHTPASDTQATITSSERQAWWTTYEAQGLRAGFNYTLIAGGNRLSTVEPAGTGTGRIRDGYNQVWDFGAGTFANRYGLPSNNGSWPNIIKFEFTGSHTVQRGAIAALKYYSQLAQSAAQTATVKIYLDNDPNPYNGNLGQVSSYTDSGTTDNYINSRNVLFDTAGIPLGRYLIYARISYGTYSRYVYAPGSLVVEAPPPPVKIFGRVVRAEDNGGLNGVTIAFSNNSGTAFTGDGGYYTQTVASGWSGRITPAFGGGKFSPAYRELSNVAADSLNQDFVWFRPPPPAAFAPVSSVAAGTTPSSVATGDFSRDGWDDIVVADMFTSSDLYKPIKAIISRGSSGFADAVGYSPGQYVMPASVAVGDFNRDGILDIVAANEVSILSSVGVLLGNGNGTFRAAREYTVGAGLFPQTIAVGDFNRDGKLDIAVTSLGSGNVSVLLGNGAGAFGSGPLLFVGGDIASLAVGDLNRDGAADIVAVDNSFVGALAVVLGNGDGTFRTAARYRPTTPFNYSPQSAAIGDFDGDSRPDVVTANGASMTVFFGNGTGGFSYANSEEATAFHTSVAVADFNGDGRLDTVTADSGLSDDTATVRLGIGDGTFANPVSYLVGSTPVSVAVGDFNGDGKPDIVTANQIGNTVGILINRTGAGCTFSISPVTAAYGVAGGTGNVSVTASNTCSWTARSTNEWITITAGANGTGGGLVTYSVAANPTASARVGTITIAGKSFSVLQEARDVVKPTVKISSPVPNGRTPNSVVSGTSQDNVGLASVFVSVGNGEFVPANGNTTWSIDLAPWLLPGTNVITAKSVDRSGNESIPVTRSFTFVASGTLMLSTNGRGSVLGATNLQQLEIGRTYTLTATPSTGFTFSNWVGDIPLTVSPRLTFTMQSNLQITANFVANPFLGLKGAYYGLFYPTDNTAAHENSGFFSLAITDKGAFSGKAMVAGGTHPMSGQFDLSLWASKTVLRGTNTPLLLELQLVAGSDRISGTVRNMDWTSELSGYRAVFNASVNPATAFTGPYTMLFSGGSSPATSPFGQSIANLVITLGGSGTFKGTLADGATALQKVPLSGDGHLPLYVKLYGGKGSLFQWLTLTNSTESDVTGAVVWTKRSGVPGPFYPSGFTREIRALGSRQFVRPPGTPILTFSSGVALLEGGNLSSTLTNNVGVSVQNKITVTLMNTNNLILTLTAPAGTLRGSFLNPETRKVSRIKGIALEKQNIAGGFFLGTNRTGSIFLGQPEDFPLIVP